MHFLWIREDVPHSGWCYVDVWYGFNENRWHFIVIPLKNKIKGRQLYYIIYYFYFLSFFSFFIISQLGRCNLETKVLIPFQFNGLCFSDQKKFEHGVAIWKMLCNVSRDIASLLYRSVPLIWSLSWVRYFNLPFFRKDEDNKTSNGVSFFYSWYEKNKLYSFILIIIVFLNFKRLCL
jgi:hypothetical protein